MIPNKSKLINYLENENERLIKQFELLLKRDKRRIARCVLHERLALQRILTWVRDND